jgi:hypothetical protein
MRKPRIESRPVGGRPRGLFCLSAIDPPKKKEAVTGVNPVTSDGLGRLRPPAPPAGPPRLSPKLAFDAQSRPSARRSAAALGRHNAALARLLRTAAPDHGAVAEKLELILRHQVFELSFGEASLEAVRRDVRRFAGGDSHT